MLPGDGREAAGDNCVAIALEAKTHLMLSRGLHRNRPCRGPPLVHHP